ncbi:MAG: hypothetical protein ACC650_03845 [Gammaproteobacteria bacterium]
MDIHSVKKFYQTALVLIGVAIFQPLASAADVPEKFQIINNVAIYLGVIPAQIIRGHPNEHPESKMHGGVKTKHHNDHVVVALFDNTSGKRIENAKVTGSIMELGLGNEHKKLDAMKINDTITYGNYFKMPSTGTYHIKLWIRIPDKQGIIEVKFTHRHFKE